MRSSHTGFISVALLAASAAFAQMGRTWPSEKKIVPDPATGLPLTFLTSTDGGYRQSKIYQTHRQWTVDGKWLVFRGTRKTGSQAFAVNEETGQIVQATENGFMGMLCVGNKTMKLVVMTGRAGRGASAGPHQMIEIDLAKLFGDVASGHVKESADYQRVAGTIPATLLVDGNMGLDANDDFVYFRVAGPETARLSEGQTLQKSFGPRNMGAGPSGLRSMNLKTGEIKTIVNVGFQIGHVQTNPWAPGEIVFCWETGGKAPQRTWFVKADGTGLRPLYPEEPYEWITHEAVTSKDEVTIAVLGHRTIASATPQSDWGSSGTMEHPTGVGIVNLRTREMRLVGQVPAWSGGRSDWHVAASADGRWAASDDFKYAVWLYDRHSGEVNLLAGPQKTGADHIHPTFNAEGTKIEIQSALISKDDRSLNVCIVPIPKAWLARTYPVRTPE
jgi:oligogalacturonide lyase